VTDTRWGQSYTAGDLPDARYRARYLTTTYTLTGENKQRPLRPMNHFITGGGLGAIEVAARVGRLWGDSVGRTDEPPSNPRAATIKPSGEHVVTFGINWTLNRFMKIQFNTFHEQVDDPDRDPVPNGAAFWSKVIRFQLVL